MSDMTAAKVGDVIVVQTKIYQGYKVRDYVVTKVGRLYFHARPVGRDASYGQGDRFHREGGLGNRTAHWNDEAFPSNEVRIAELQVRERQRVLRSLIGGYGIRVERLTPYEVEQAIKLLAKAGGGEVANG